MLTRVFEERLDVVSKRSVVNVLGESACALSWASETIYNNAAFEKANAFMLSNHPARKPLTLIVLDGWGYREDPQYNAIAAARKPNWDRLWTYPHMLIDASAGAVGLPENQMGNSEVGHLNLGAGRVVYQEYTRVSRAISSGEFFRNPALTEGVDAAIKHDGAVHVLGLLSPGGVHSHEDQIHAMVELAAKRGAAKLYVHAFLDGRDTPPQSAGASLDNMTHKFAALGVGQIASICGRYYAMDRDKRWDRVQRAYDLLTLGQGDFRASDARAALAAAYERGETDEFVKPTAVAPNGVDPACVSDGDTVVFMNFRADRARQLTSAFTQPDFQGFSRRRTPKLARFVTLTQYNAEFKAAVAFPPTRLENTFGAYIAERGLHQLRVAETEKYAHVTFFFNGGIEAPYKNEDRILVPSPQDVATYDLKPEMSAPTVANEIVKATQSGKYDVIISNFANADMVGHSGNIDATVKAIEAVDAALGRILDATLAAGGELLITSDHGNAEEMFDAKTGQPHTAHTTNPVPLIYVGRPARTVPNGALEDIAPTMLYLMGLPIPSEMTGHSLVELRAGNAMAGAKARG
jgi:2,3-bisphosphoglycerate-independent phosphoglycerate mutase